MSDSRFLGFDTSGYPGDSAMSVWKSQSPFRFVGYYLKAPCHSHSTWIGHRAALEGAGWGLAVIYVGRQVQGPCSGTPVSGALGNTDGIDAVHQCTNEGFAPNTVVFLDVEHMDVIPDAMKAYVLAWFQAVAASPFVPGMYCHVRNATALKAAATVGYPAGKPQPRFWVAGGTGFDRNASVPAKSGVPFANLWQGILQISESHGTPPVTIPIDVDVADAQNPSGVYVSTAAPPPAASADASVSD